MFSKSMSSVATTETMKESTMTDSQRGRSDHHCCQHQSDCRDSRSQVRFSSDPSYVECRLPYYPHDDNDIDEAEATKRRSMIWFTDKEYKEIQQDREATIRMYRSVQGEMSEELEEFYCLRGLEPYQSPSLQSKLFSQRSVYKKAVLTQQRALQLARFRQKLLQNDNESCADENDCCLAESIKPRVEQLSQWAMERALKQAAMDEAEARKICGRSKLMRRLSMGHSAEPASKRRCVRTMTMVQSEPELNKAPITSSAVPSHTRVNVQELKEMNRRLLQQMGIKSNSFGVGLKPPASQVDSAAVPPKRNMSLNALMRASYRKVSLPRLATPLPNVAGVSQLDVTDFTSKLLNEHSGLSAQQSGYRRH